MDNKTTLQIGNTLEGEHISYKITDVLGQGSFGVTYKAKAFTRMKGAFGEELVESSTPKAIKEFYMKEVNSRDGSGSITGITPGGIAYNYAQKFRREAENLAMMDHPNIVKVIDFVEANNTFYYVMDFIDGCNLNVYLKNHRLSESDIVRIIGEVCSALNYMHSEKRLLHLDLKPGNIMIRTADMKVFLIDFGLSKHYTDNGEPESSTSVGLGTEGYAPIEQGKKSKNDNEFRPTIDVYALGATLFKMLTGKTPPSASDVLNDDELLTNMMDEAHVSKALQDVVVDAMQPVAKKRIQTVNEFWNRIKGSTNNDVEETLVSIDEEATRISLAAASQQPQQTHKPQPIITQNKPQPQPQPQKPASPYQKNNEGKANYNAARHTAQQNDNIKQEKKPKTGCIIGLIFAGLFLILGIVIAIKITSGSYNEYNNEYDDEYSDYESVEAEEEDSIAYDDEDYSEYVVADSVAVW